MNLSTYIYHIIDPFRLSLPCVSYWIIHFWGPCKGGFLPGISWNSLSAASYHSVALFFPWEKSFWWDWSLFHYQRGIKTWSWTPYTWRSLGNKSNKYEQVLKFPKRKSYGIILQYLYQLGVWKLGGTPLKKNPPIIPGARELMASISGCVQPSAAALFCRAASTCRGMI